MIFDTADAEYLRIATTIEEFVAGTGRKWDWDDLISLPSRDPYLQHVQSECNEMQSRFPASRNAGYCNEDGRKALLELAKDIRSKVGVWPRLAGQGGN